MTETLSLTTCSCHVIDPNKFPILVWKRVRNDKSSYLLLKIADQRFIGSARTDKKGETYWKFKQENHDEQVNLLNQETNGKPTNSEINTNS